MLRAISAAGSVIDLHVFDAEGLIQISGHLVTANSNVGMGDLRAFESEDIVLPLDQMAG